MRADELTEFAERWPNWFTFQGPLTRSPLNFGFDGVGEGWRQLLWDLCVELEPHVESLDREIATREPQVNFVVLQVKEKFGGLRFYTTLTSKAIDDCIRRAQERALSTCMDCGQPARLRTQGRWHVACDACATNRTHDHEHATDADLIEPDQLPRDLARGYLSPRVRAGSSERSGMSERDENTEPQVGIFWLWGERLIMHATAFTEAERWGRYLNAIGHERHWADLQIAGQIPGDVEYTEPPRGRVVYDTISRKYFLYADRCILSRSELIKEIIQRLGLFVETVEISGDEHYRCADCLRCREV
jgi:hypothetical protein